METAFCGSSSTWTKEPTNNSVVFYRSLGKLFEKSGRIPGSETPNTLTMISKGNMLTNLLQPVNRMTMTEAVVSESDQSFEPFVASAIKALGLPGIFKLNCLVSQSGHSFESAYPSAAKTLEQLRLLKPNWVVFGSRRYLESVCLCAIETLEQLRLINPNRDVWGRRRYLKSSYPSAIKTLEQLRSLKTNWDSYGAKKPSSDTIEQGYELLIELERAAKDAGVALPEPEVGPGAKGSIQFEWNMQGKEFEIEFLVVNDQTRYDCLLCPSENEDEWEEEQFTGDLLGHSCIKTFLKWI